MEGLENITLRHPHHRTFHREVISQADDLDFTRYYRWHIDAALYDLNPPLVTTLLAVSLPSKRRQIVRYDDGSGDELDVSWGTTAIVNGYRCMNLCPKRTRTLSAPVRLSMRRILISG
jgi:hypothetical protein